jgi:hypothetical protein
VNVHMQRFIEEKLAERRKAAAAAEAAAGGGGGSGSGGREGGAGAGPRDPREVDAMLYAVPAHLRVSGGIRDS